MTNSVLDPVRYPVLSEAHLRHARVVSNRLAALTLWPRDAVIAEVGVALGEFSKAVLAVCRPRRFLAIDRFDLHQLPALWGIPTSEHFNGLTHGEFYRSRFATEIASGQVEVIEGDSAAVISALPDCSVDVFYVDADHTYDGVRRDLDAILPKVKPDGWIVMNDYIPAEIGFSNATYGVIQATNEFMITHGWEMVYFALAYVMYCDVGLRKASSAIDKVLPEIDARAAYLATALTGTKALNPRSSAEDFLLEALQIRIANLEKALTMTRQSSSWRMTAPLRAIARALGRR